MQIFNSRLRLGDKLKFRTQREELTDVNITPLIDIVFLLLIFFMVSTTFNEEFELGIELPQANSESAAKESILEITITAEGMYFVNQKRLVNNEAATLMRAVQTIAGRDRAIPVILSADARTPHQSVITAMDVVRQLGFNRLSFATQKNTSK